MNNLQSKLLDLLNFVDKLARDNDIPYWIDGGTLLGAVRHGGFIPWDNDIDVNLLVKDYNKLLPILRKECSQHSDYFLYRDLHIPYWAKYLADVSMLEEGIQPIRIDIIPIYHINSGKQYLEDFNKEVDIGRWFIQGSLKYPYRADLRLPKKIECNRIGDYKAKQAHFNNIHDKYSKAFGPMEEDSLLTYSFHDALVSKSRDLYTYNQIFPLTEIKFEGRHYPAPKNVDSYLKLLYGENYIEPPKLKDRKSKQLTVTKNKYSKEKIEKIILLFSLRETLLYKARIQKSIVNRFFIKALISIHIFRKSLSQKVPIYLFMQVKYSILKRIMKFK